MRRFKFIISWRYFCNFVIISQCKKVWHFHLNKLKSFLPCDAFCEVWLTLAKWFYRRFLNFGYFVIISPWKNGWPFIWINLYTLHPMMIWAKFDWNWRFFKIVNLFSIFHNYIPLEIEGAFHLNKLEFPSPKDDLCQVWLKLAQWFWRRRFLKFINVFSLFRNYLPLEKSKARLHLKKLESPSPKNAVCQVWLKLAHWFWSRRFLKRQRIFTIS